jgi:hypothetical protein
MKIVLTKETKDSFKLFDDIFKFFRLSGLKPEERLNDAKSLSKYEWEHLDDLLPLNITTTIDMLADWKLSGVGVGVKKTKMFCTLCPCSNEVVHLPSESHCDRFCHDQPNNWHCCHHAILCNDVKADLMQEAKLLKDAIARNLNEITALSKIRYYPSSASPCTHI